MTRSDSHSFLSSGPADDQGTQHRGSRLFRFFQRLVARPKPPRFPDPLLDITGPRTYPVLTEDTSVALRPISFVTVHFCDDYYHNLLRSACVQNPLNQLVTVDTRWGHQFDTLSAAITSGLQQTIHDLVAVVHEDVLLPPGWQHRLQRSLTHLTEADPNWGLAGSVGWDKDGTHVGHWSDPHRYRDTLEDRDFGQVPRVDEQILIFRKSRGLTFDPMLPSIHNIGHDLTAKLAQSGQKTYAVNAPTIHKYADETGTPIETAMASAKIRTRTHPANLAEWACSNDYLYAKWPQWRPKDDPVEDLTQPADLTRYPPPVILLSRGGSGSRLLSVLAADLGLFLGNDVNASGDAMDMSQAIYRAILATYQQRVDWQRKTVIPRLQAHAAKMLDQAAPTHPSGFTWGFKLPESLLVLPQIEQAFPNARYVHMLRDPLATCLRRTHMTARFDNAIGRTAIRAAYAHCGRPIAQSLQDSPALHMAYTTRHQIESTLRFAQDRLQSRYLEIRFEDLLGDPTATRKAVADWLGIAPVGTALNDTIDPERAAKPKTTYDPQIVAHTTDALATLRKTLGYV